jgi:hypothetical protein
LAYHVADGNPQTINYIYDMALGDFLPIAAYRYDHLKLMEQAKR